MLISSIQSTTNQIQKPHDELVALILESSPQRKRIMKVQETVQCLAGHDRPPGDGQEESIRFNLRDQRMLLLAHRLLEVARRNLQSIQDEEQILLNRKTLAHEWPIQSSQMLNFLPKLERSVIEMEKEKRGFLLTGENSFADAYKRAVADFYTVHGYLTTLVVNSSEQAGLLGRSARACRTVGSSIRPFRT